VIPIKVMATTVGMADTRIRRIGFDFLIFQFPYSFVITVLRYNFYSQIYLNFQSLNLIF